MDVSFSCGPLLLSGQGQRADGFESGLRVASAVEEGVGQQVVRGGSFLHVHSQTRVQKTLWARDGEAASRLYDTTYIKCS